MEIDQEIIAKDIEEVRKHVELDSRDPKIKVYRLCTVCKRPTAGHPPDTRGKYPGYGVNNCKLDKIGDTDANYLCEQLDRIEEMKKQMENVRLSGNCTLCNKIFEDIQIHIIDKHTFDCDYCTATLKTASELEHHRLSHQQKCSKCERTFQNKDLLSKHMRSSHVEKHRCDECKIEFNSNSELSRHDIDKHSEEYVKCRECDDEFANKERLERHVKTIHRRKSPLKGITPRSSRSKTRRPSQTEERRRGKKKDGSTPSSSRSRSNSISRHRISLASLLLQEKEAREEERRERIRREEKEEDIRREERRERIRREEREDEIRRQDREDRLKREEEERKERKLEREEREAERRSEKEAREAQLKIEKESFETERHQDKVRLEVQKQTTRTLICPKWCQDEDLEIFKAKALIWDENNDAKPEVKLLKFLECIEDHTEEHRRVTIETIKNDSFDKGCKNIIKECFKIIEKYFGKSKVEKSLELWRQFKSIRMLESQSISDYLRQFEEIEIKMRNIGITLPHRILALELLEGAHMTEHEKKAAIDKCDLNNDETIYEQMKEGLRKMKNLLVVSQKQSEPPKDVFYTRDHSGTYIPAFKNKYSGGYQKKNREESYRGSRGGQRGDRNRWSWKSKSRSSSRDRKYHSGEENKETHEKPKQKHSPWKRRINSPGNRVYYAKASETTKEGDVVKLDGPLYVENSDGEIIEEPSAKIMNTYKVSFQDKNDINKKETYEKILIDCAATKTVSGVKWLQSFTASNKLNEAKEGKDDSAFRFGPSQADIYYSKKTVTIPVVVGSSRLEIKSSIIDAEIPMLIGNDCLKQLGAVIDIEEKTLHLKNTGETIQMKETASGHFEINIKNNKLVNEIFFNSQGLKEELEELDDSDLWKHIEKIHNNIGHPTPDNLKKLFHSAGHDDKRINRIIDNIKEACKTCLESTPPPPRPKVALPKAEDFNDVVSVDLKDLNHKHGKYIMYMVDEFTSLIRGKVISNKEPATIIEALKNGWILGGGLGPGFPAKLFSDNGGEFVNDQMIELASKSGFRLETGAAYSGWMNGHNERRHAVVDNVMKRVQKDDPTLSLQEALDLALFITNATPGKKGFSAHQLVYGCNPRIPGIINATPASISTQYKYQNIRNLLVRIELTREAFRKVDADQRLKKALKERTSKYLNKFYRPGSEVYYYDIDQKEWIGPCKAIAQDSKVIVIQHGGFTRRIPSCRVLATGEKIEREVDAPTKTLQTAILNAKTLEDEEKNLNINPEIIVNDEEIDCSILKTNVKGRPNRGSYVRFFDENIKKWKEGKVSQVGKKTGNQYNTCWIKVDNNITEMHDFNNILEWETKVVPKTVSFEKQGQVVQESENSIFFTNFETKPHNLKLKVKENEQDKLGAMHLIDVYLTTIPASRHGEPQCVEAKQKELDNWDTYGAFKEVDYDENMEKEIITCRWVLVEKDDKIKARLVVRGFQETIKPQADSPTAAKESTKVLSAIAANESWEIEALDVSAAFLQGKSIEREVLLIPPKERRTEGKIWRLIKPAYGLNDGSRLWFAQVKEQLKVLGGRQLSGDEALFYFLDENCEDQPKLRGIIACHVDDLYTAGDNTFKTTVRDTLIKKFSFGKMERREFTFTGLQIKQNPENSEITMDQNKYISSIDEVGEIRKESDEVKLNRQELRDFRGIVGQLSWAQLTTRPDLTYDALEMSTKNQSATIGDMKRLKKVVNKAKNPDNNISIKYRKLGHFKKLHIEGFSDASYPTNFDENIRDVAGSVVLLCNDEGLCSPLHWKGKTITKTCSNVKAAELHALQSAIDDSVYLARTIHELYTGEENGQLPVDMYIDSDGLKENIQSTKQIEEKRKRRDVANIKKMIVDGEVRSVSWMKGKEMLADCLTKRDANPGRLRDLLRSGINPNIRQKNIVYFCNLENSED